MQIVTKDKFAACGVQGGTGTPFVANKGMMNPMMMGGMKGGMMGK